jgi:hypothetical protein
MMRYRQIILVSLLLVYMFFTVGSANTQSATTIPVQIVLSPGLPEAAARARVTPVVAVAILSSETFDARGVDPQSLSFVFTPNGPAGRGQASPCEERDINRDARLDSVCQVQLVPRTPGLRAQAVVLEGQTFDGVRFRGELRLPLRPNR